MEDRRYAGVREGSNIPLTLRGRRGYRSTRPQGLFGPPWMIRPHGNILEIRLGLGARAAGRNVRRRPTLMYPRSTPISQLFMWRLRTQCASVEP